MDRTGAHGDDVLARGAFDTRAGIGARREVAADADPSQSQRVLPLADRERLGKVLAELEPRLTAAALRVTRDPDGARDVVQSAFEKVIRHGARFEGKARVSTWVHRIAVNEALMWLRARRRRLEDRHGSGEVALERAADPRPGPEECALRRQQHGRLRRGLAQLPRPERELLLQCALGDVSYAEYADRTGAHPGAVKTRAYRARRRLAEWMLEPEPPRRMPPAGPLRGRRTP
jgi:RNA polymerase sigma-70 factor (ECF subfamily)